MFYEKNRFTKIYLSFPVCVFSPYSRHDCIGTVNINTATAEEFAANVPLIDKELAERIVEYREETGDFQVLEELLQIDGFTRKMLRRLKPFFLLEGLGGDECTC